MYAKLFKRIASSSLMEEDIPTRYLFVMMISQADQSGLVVGTEETLARTVNMPVNMLKRCLKKLLAPDPKSNSASYEGCRLIPSDGEKGWVIVNYVAYRNLRDDNDRRAYMREYMRAKRKQALTRVNSVNSGKLPLAQAEAEADTEFKALNFEASGGAKAQPADLDPESSKFKAFEKLNFREPNGQEQELIDRCMRLLGKDCMVNYGGSWRNRARDDPEKLDRVLNEVARLQKEGAAIRHAGACANDLWERFK